MTDFLNQDKDFPMLVSHCVNVMGALAGEPISKEESWIAYSEGIGTKLLGHLVNIYSLYNGTHIKLNDNKNIKFIIITLIKLLTSLLSKSFFKLEKRVYSIVFVLLCFTF